MKHIAIILALASLSAFASDPISEALKKAADKERRLQEKIKKYGLKETPGYRIIGVSEPYFIIDGKQVPCDSVEWVCKAGRCVPVQKGK